jgi:hypothetical protein
LTRRPTVRAALLVACVALVAVACTDDGGDGDVPVSEVAPTTTAPPDRVTTSIDVEPLPVDDEPLDLPRDAPPSGDGESLGPLGETEVQFETDEGSVEIGDASIPAAAEAFPVPDDFAVLISSETATDLGFSGESMLVLDELVAFYDVELEEAGFTVVGRRVSPGAFAVYDIERSGQVGQVALSASASVAGSTLIVALDDGL